MLVYQTNVRSVLNFRSYFGAAIQSESVYILFPLLTISCCLWRWLAGCRGYEGVWALLLWLNLCQGSIVSQDLGCSFGFSPCPSPPFSSSCSIFPGIVMFIIIVMRVIHVTFSFRLCSVVEIGGKDLRTSFFSCMAVFPFLALHHNAYFSGSLQTFCLDFAVCGERAYEKVWIS